MASAQPKVRIGFVGVGKMGQCAHLKNYAVLPDCEVVAIAELRQELARKVAARYGVPRIYPTHAAMLAQEKLDGVVAPQQFTNHGVLLPDLLKTRLPLLIEKPLAASVQVGERIVEAVTRSGAPVMVGYHKRSDPATIWTKQQIESLKQSGELGKLRYVRITMPPGEWIAGGFDELIKSDEPVPNLEQDPPPPDMDQATFKRYSNFVNYYSHQLNLLRHLLGEPYSVSFADRSGLLLVGESASGIPCLIEMQPYRTTVDWQESAFVAFERGWIRLDLPAPMAANRPGRVEIYRDPGGGQTPQRMSPQLPWVHAMRQQAINFLRVVRGEAQPLCTAEEALEDLRVARAYIRLTTR